MSKETWLTTLDNPFDPFEESENWRRYDEDHGYYTNNLIARCVAVHDEMDDDTFHFQVEQIVDQFVRFNPLGIYRKAVKGENNVLPEEKRLELVKKMEKGEL